MSEIQQILKHVFAIKGGLSAKPPVLVGFELDGSFLDIQDEVNAEVKLPRASVSSRLIRQAHTQMVW